MLYRVPVRPEVWVGKPSLSVNSNITVVSIKLNIFPIFFREVFLFKTMTRCMTKRDLGRDVIDNYLLNNAYETFSNQRVFSVISGD